MPAMQKKVPEPLFLSACADNAGEVFWEYNFKTKEQMLKL